MKKLLLGLLLLASPAFAQSVQMSPPVTARHLPYWVTSGVIGDGGSSADSPITSMGVTNNGGAGICVSSDRQAAAGRNQLCFGAQTSGAAFISLQNYGTAPAEALQFVINGVTSNLTTSTSGATVGHIPTFGASNVLQDSGLAASGGSITQGAWAGTPIPVAEGGTGATTQAGARTNLGLGSMATQNSSAVAITGGTITGLPTPTNASDAAIKSYVDATSQGLNILPASRLATATVLPNTPTYSNGTSGVGATLTAGSNSTLTVDGTVANLNDVILVQNQASAFQNGIYTVTTAGDGGTEWVLTRATYFDQAAEMVHGSYTFITAGTANTNTSWVLQSTVATVGTTAATFNQFSSTGSGVTSLGGATGALTVGAGINVTGSVVNTAAGVSSNVLNSQGGNYPIVAGDAGKTINVSGGPFTVTLPSVSGFATNATVSVCNANANIITSHAVLLSGFPNPIFARLYPQQCVSVSIENGVWTATTVPGRFRPTYQTTLFVDTGGSDSNDGLISNAAGNALRNAQTCANILGEEYDLQFTQPICSLTGGQTFGPVSITGQFVNASVMFFNGNGSNAVVKATATSGTSALFLGDFAPYVISVSMTWDCTSAAAGCVALSLHQQGGMDLNSGTILKGGASTHVGLNCDSVCKVNGGATITLSGTMLNGLVGNLGSMFNFGGGVTLADNTTIASDIILITGSSQLQFSGGLNAGSSDTISEIFGLRGNGTEACISNLTTTGAFGAARQWSVLNNAQFVNTSAQVVPGSTGGINTLATWGNGIVVNSGTSAGGC